MKNGILAQLGEHLPYKQGVTGSSPVGPIDLARWLNWLERPVHTREVESSSLSLATEKQSSHRRALFIRGCTGFDGVLKAGEASRMECVKCQT